MAVAVAVVVVVVAGYNEFIALTGVVPEEQTHEVSSPQLP